MIDLDIDIENKKPITSMESKSLASILISDEISFEKDTTGYNIGLGSDPKPVTKPTLALKNLTYKNVTTGFGLFGLDYWKVYFDINQYEIKERCLSVLNPFSPKFSTLINEKPDFYSPFYICAALIFILSISGHFSTLFLHVLLNFGEIIYYQNSDWF